jgi:methionine aminopeptidase
LGTPSIQAKAARRDDVRGDVARHPRRQARSELGDIGHTIQEFAEGHHFSVVREFCGHGIGRQFHEEPQVVHYGRPGTGMQLQPGMIFTIEPMINAGARRFVHSPTAGRSSRPITRFRRSGSTRCS